MTLLTSATVATAQSVVLAKPDAEPQAWRWTTEPSSRIDQSNFALPPTDQNYAGGPPAHQRGIMVGADVGPGTTIGLGLMSTKPRRSAFSPDPALDGRARGSRKAAVRLIMKF